MSEPQEAPVEVGQADLAPVDSGQASESSNVWFDSAEDEVKGYIQNKGWDDPLKAVEAYQNLEKFHGVPSEKIIKLPKDGEPLDEVYDRLGRPESPDKYEISFPDGVNPDEQYMSGVKELAHKIGLNSDQLKALAEYQANFEMSYINEQSKQVEAEQAAELNQLKAEWGTAFEERAELGRRFVSQNLPDGVDKADVLQRIESAIGTSTMLKLFGNAGSRFAEQDIPSSEGDRAFGYTPEQAKADKAALMSELSASPERLKSYNAQIGPDYDKMQRLIKVISG